MDSINPNDLLRSIQHWNEYRVPILKISNPDKNLNFQGAIRFYFQDAGQRIATKCVNVTSANNTKDVIDILIEKFRPDMRMLSVPEYGLYEIHENGEERKLDPNERPLLVQLEWNKDDREGRFLLRRMDEETRELTSQYEEPSLKRKLSKTEKKKQKKAEAAATKLSTKNKNGIAERLYNELPETSFTRSISNPEAVMKRRRAQKLERRLQELSLDSGQQAGGTLRIFGETIDKDVSYKTLLLSTKDTASIVIKQILEKYGKEDEDPNNYCLVYLIVPSLAASPGGEFNNTSTLREYILDDQECPLLINQNHDESKGVLTFHIRHKPADYQKRKKSKPPRPQVQQDLRIPFVVPDDGYSSEMSNRPQDFSSYPSKLRVNDQDPRLFTVQPTIPPTGANDHILPALIQVKEEMEDIFLSRVITHIKPDITFRLAPTYVLYMVSRYRASTLFHPELQAPRRAELFMPFTTKIASMIRNTIEVHHREPAFLAFWLANSSDLSHFYKQDKHLSHFTIDAQGILYDSIKHSFKYLLTCKQKELDSVLPTFFDDRDDLFEQHEQNRPNINGGISPINQILNVLNDTMATMRKNRVNAALTIQIFSHLFHHISKWLFDRLIGVYDRQPNLMIGQTNFGVYCNRTWGEILHRRLDMIGNWAEKQGLEQASDYHLARVTQVTKFLAGRYPERITPNDFQFVVEDLKLLNPVQLRLLLQRYQPEYPTLQAIIRNFLYLMDYSYMANDQPLEEDPELKIPFLIPEDGYSSEMIRRIPPGLVEFVSYLSQIRVNDRELCIFTVQPTSSGFWTVYFRNQQPDTPEIITLQLRKKNNSMGLSIIAAKGVGQERLGIYIKNVVKNGAAAMDRRLQAGDQLLEVDGNSLLDINQEKAAELMQKTAPVVTLKIAKQAAIYHHLLDVINSVPNQTVVSPQVVTSPNFIPPPPLETVQSAPILERPFVNPPIQYVERHHIQPHQPEMPHFQPPPPAMPFDEPPLMNHINPPSLNHTNPPSLNHTNPTSPLKSPKKVSWVDTQPHQSLHTLIPPSPSLQPSPNAQIPSPDAPSPPTQLEESYNNNVQHLNVNEYTNGQSRSYDEDEDEEDELGQPQECQPAIPASFEPETITNSKPNAVKPTANGQLDTTTESLTLEDIDEVLSSRTHNNWLEDSAGVIGTQEVYNDPRHRIAKERERPNDDVNVEKLSFHEKLKMFSSKK